MAVTYGFFNSVNGDRKYNADTMSEFYTGICTQGVFQHVDNGLAVSAGTGLTVNVASGRAIIQGHWVKNDAALTLSIDAASATYARIDAVVIRYSASNRNIQIVVKTGTPAASPSAPSMTRAGGVYELCLAYVNVAANATSVTVTDKRSDSSVCGWAAVAQATSGEVDQMLNDMKTGFDGVVYNSPGAAVRGSDQKLQSDIDVNRNAIVNGVAEENLMNTLIWEQGGINSNTGLDNNGSTVRHYFVRTHGYTQRQGSEKTIKITTPSSAYVTITFFYDSSQAFIGKTGNISADTEITMPDNAVYFRSTLYNANEITPEAIPSGYSIKSIVKLNIDKHKKIITVGPSGKDYTSLRSAFEYANSVKWMYDETEVQVFEGSYYINDYYTSTEWADANFIGLSVPDGIRVVGVGNVDNIIIYADDTTANQKVSTLNIQSSVYMSNVTVKAEHLRYTIHDDYADAGIIGGHEQIFVGCKFIGKSPEHGRTFGSGQRSGARWKFENCEFTGETNDCVPFAVHNNTDFVEQAYVDFIECKFISNQRFSVYLSSLNSNGVFTNIRFDGCTFDAGSGNTPTIDLRKDGYNYCMFKVLSTCCNEITTNNRTDTEAPEVIIRP